MVMPRKGQEPVVREPFDLPAFKLEVQGLVESGILGEFVETLGPVSLEDIEHLKRRYASLIIQLDRLRPALAAANVTARAKDGSWSIKEMIGHLIDADRDIWWPRIEALLRDEARSPKRPHFADIDHHMLVREHGWQSQPLEDILAQFVRARWHYAMNLNAISPSEFERCGEHAVLGEICILRMVQILVAHDAHYLAKINAMI